MLIIKFLKNKFNTLKLVYGFFCKCKRQKQLINKEKNVLKKLNRKKDKQ